MGTGTKKTAKRKARGANVVREGSGNVFADLQLPDSGEALAKAELATQIASAIADRNLTQVRAAELLGVNQADVSDLVRGKLKGFSTGRLLRFLNALGQDIEIVIHSRRRSNRLGRLQVRDAGQSVPVGRGTGRK
jgi:predicted XRE-type DNA-binding protein